VIKEYSKLKIGDSTGIVCQADGVELNVRRVPGGYIFEYYQHQDFPIVPGTVVFVPLEKDFQLIPDHDGSHKP
jgi:hypothetical protein|tara:strand:- start:2901 stop:3119 length:219 start_codon:yes stop_codon:yes gene_type:complete